MKKFVSMALIFALMLTLSNAASPRLSAEDIKPVVTVSFAGYDEVRANIDAIGKLGGNAGLAPFLENMLSNATQGKGLNGLNKKAPWGYVMTLTPQGQPSGFGFVPVTDLKQLTNSLANSPAGIKVQENGGVYEIVNPKGEKFYVAQRGKIAAIVKDKADLDGIPAEPEKLLGDLPQKYLIAIQVSVKNVPEALRDQGLAFFNMMSQGMQRGSGDETDEQIARKQKMAQRNIENVTMFVKESEQVVLGLNIDRKTNKVDLDLDFVAQEGTKLAEKFANVKPGKTNLAGFDLPNAAIVANSVGTMSDKDVEEAKDTLQLLHDQLADEVAKQELTDEQMKLVKELLGEALSIADKNLESKKSDFGMALCLEPSAVTFVAGAAVADGKPIEKLVKKLFDAAKEEDASVAEAVKFNAENYKGIRFHTLSLPTPQEELKPFVGDTLDLVLGVGEKQAFVSFGRDAAKILKQAIDKSQSEANKEVPPFLMSISAKQIAKFGAAVAPDDAKMQLQMALGMLEQAGDKDHLLISGQGIPNGMKLRIELEEGFLKVLGSATQMLGGGMGGMPGGPSESEQ